MFCFENKLWQAMKSRCYTIMWTRRDHGTSEMNHHQPHQSPAFFQRRWWCVCGGVGSFLSWAPSGKPVNSNEYFSQLDQLSSTWWKVSEISQQKMHYLPSGLCKTACFFDDQAETVTAWPGGSISSSMFTRYCIFRFPCILFFLQNSLTGRKF